MIVYYIIVVNSLLLYSVRQGSKLYGCFKAATLTEEDEGLLVKITNHVEEIKFHDRAGVMLFLIIFGNVAAKKMARKGRAKRMESSRTKNKRGSPLVIINML